MLAFSRPKAVRKRELFPDEAVQFIQSLRRFITPSELARRTADYLSPRRQSGVIQIARLRERQPLIEAFQDYDEQSSRGLRILNHLTDNVADLAQVGMYCHVVSPTLDGRLRKVHRDKLVNLDGQLHPLILEWRLASHYANTLPVELAWFDVDQSSPEFVVRSGGVMWEVECKRVSHMIAELLGDSESDALAERTIRAVTEKGLCGEISLSLTLDFVNLATADQEAKVDALLGCLAPGQSSGRNEGFAELSGSLHHKSGAGEDVAQWQRRVQASNPPYARGYAQANAVEGKAIDPVTLFLGAPQRESHELLEHLWQRKFKKAAEQCTGDRGAVLAFEWEGVTEPSLFLTNQVQGLMARTMAEHRHIASILLCCDPGPLRMTSSTDFAVTAYQAMSKVTDFPEVLKLAHLTRGL